MVKKTLTYVLITFLGIGLIYFISPHIYKFGFSIGIIQKRISISGTGSMYPTFPKGQSNDEKINAKEEVASILMRVFPGGIKIFNYHLFPYKLKHGDIVEFSNKKTKEISLEKYQEESGFVKRVIALPGDTIELRDGFVKLNGIILDEPYTAKPRSTYGGSFLSDCKPFTIPPGKVFVLGDNRKASLDSRYELGLLSFEDIHYVLSWDKQNQYKSLWRNTYNDQALANTPTLDIMEFINILNNKRLEKKLSLYKYNSLLSYSSKLRGNVMLKHNDFSPEATRSGINLKRAIKEAGYNNIIVGEIYTRGYYDATELFENFSEFVESKKMLFSKDYQDIGLSVINGELESCPTQVVIVHFGGYIPPNYSRDLIDSWQKLVDNLEKVMPSWLALKEADNIDKEKLNRLLVLFNTRLANAKTILAKMKANQWLNDEENKLVDDDKKLGEESEKIISELTKKQ
uniref:Signal peptidase I n=1 Tax=candidate division CPR3 bacterium TaxID=2268181 RepID=A0A7C4M5R3_UNCC3